MFKDRLKDISEAMDVLLVGLEVEKKKHLEVSQYFSYLFYKNLAKNTKIVTLLLLKILN